MTTHTTTAVVLSILGLAACSGEAHPEFSQEPPSNGLNVETTAGASVDAPTPISIHVQPWASCTVQVLGSDAAVANHSFVTAYVCCAIDLPVG
jgi:hypothetical protein